MHCSAERLTAGAPETHGEFTLWLGGVTGLTVISCKHHRVAVQRYYITVVSASSLSG